MANAGGVTVDGGDMMRYAEYAPKTNVRSDAEIDRRLVSVSFHPEDHRGVCQTKPVMSVLCNLYDR